MRNSNIFAAILCLLFIFAPSSFSQTGDVIPDLKINCPTEKVEAGAKFRLSAVMKPEIPNSVYNWTVLNGTITSGQGTKEIEIQPFGKETDSITAVVESFAFFVTIRDDCTFEILKKPMPQKIDELQFSTQGELKARLDSYFNELAATPSARFYIIIYSPSPRQEARVVRIIRDHIGFRKVDSSRITLITGEKRDIRPILHFWIIPEGADFSPDSSETPEPKPLYLVGANPSACELNGLYLHNLRQELANNPNASLEIRYLDGKGESEAVSRKRIELLRKFLEKQVFVPITFVRAGTTEGNAETQIFVKKPGQKEMYFLQIYAIKNKSICFACCDPADMPKNLAATPKKKKSVKKR